MNERETPRLRLRRWRARDFDAYAAYHSEAETARFVGGVMDRDRAWRRFASELGHWELRGFGYWAVEEKQTGRFVGAAGLWRSAGWPELELGYWLLPEMQGRGYATEAADEARRCAFADLRATSLVSYIHPENEPSKRVAARLGARFEEVVELLTHGPHCIYRYDVPGSD